MTTHAIVTQVLGHAVEAAGARELAAFQGALRRLAATDWDLPTAASGATIADVVVHVSAGTTRLAQAWSRRLDPDPGPMQHPIHDPGAPVDPESAPSSRDAESLLAAYVDSVQRLLNALATCRLDDWAWPVWSPLGGTETLASAARRWLAHHRVHHHDVVAAVGRTAVTDDDTDALVNEFVLDAMARRGGPAVTPPLRVEVIVDPPGAGTWTLVIDAPHVPEDLPPLWREIVAPEERREIHRLERGAADDGRLIIRTDGETLWRAAFRRGAAWRDLAVHGDDGARGEWARLLAAVASDTSLFGPVVA